MGVAVFCGVEAKADGACEEPKADFIGLLSWLKVDNGLEEPKEGTEGFALCPKADDPKADFVEELVRPKADVPNAGTPADFWPKAVCPNAPPPDTVGVSDEPKVEPV